MVETVFLAAMLSLLVMVTVELLPSSILAVRRADDQFVGESLAQSLLEEQLERPFPSLTVGSRTEAVVRRSNQPVFTTVLSIAPAPGQDPAYARLVEVQVSWTRRQTAYEVRRSRVVCNLQN